MGRMKRAFHGQTFESESVFDGMWSVGIAPYGLMECDKTSSAAVPIVGNAVLYLQCVAVPRGCRAMTVRVKMRCEELLYESRPTERVMAVDDAKSTTIVFSDRTLNKLRSKGMAEATVRCEITVIRVHSEGDPIDIGVGRMPEIDDRISKDSR